MPPTSPISIRLSEQIDPPIRENGEQRNRPRASGILWALGVSPCSDVGSIALETGAKG